MTCWPVGGADPIGGACRDRTQRPTPGPAPGDRTSACPSGRATSPSVTPSPRAWSIPMSRCRIDSSGGPIGWHASWPPMPPPRNFPSATPTSPSAVANSTTSSDPTRGAPWPWTRTWSPSSAAETTCCGRASTSTVWPSGWREPSCTCGRPGRTSARHSHRHPRRRALQRRSGDGSDPHGQPLHHRATPRLLGAQPVGMASDPRLAHVGRDRIHLNTEGHTRVAQAALVALGLRPSTPDWDNPLPPDGPRRRSRRTARARRVGQGPYRPWVQRRVRGTSSGEALQAKRPNLTPVD